MYAVAVTSFMKTVAMPIVNKWHAIYHRKPRIYQFQGAAVNVLPGVYSPISSVTTAQMLEFISALNLRHKTVLELGCGSGIIAKYCAQEGALVTASDICEKALNELRASARKHADNIIAVYSDVLENLPFHFDYIFINPPHRPKALVKKGDNLEYCGAHFEFFDRLFSQLNARDIKQSSVYMILPEDAEIFAISRRAQQYQLHLKTEKIWQKRIQKIALYQILTTHEPMGQTC